jgi:hypothetical protein
MRRAAYFIGFLISGTMLLAALLQTGSESVEQAKARQIPAKQDLVRQLGLTDLALWSEARYTRHPSQADLFSAFQDYPGALDHFPAGSIITPGTPDRTTSLSFRKKGQP